MLAVIVFCTLDYKSNFILLISLKCLKCLKVFVVGTDPLISILFSWIHWLYSPDSVRVICVRNRRLWSRYGAWGRLSLKSKISSMSTIETRLFWPYSYILFKVVYRNTQYMCIILVANIIWYSGHAICSSFPLDFSFLHHSCRRVFIVFYFTAL